MERTREEILNEIRSLEGRANQHAWAETGLRFEQGRWLHEIHGGKKHGAWGHLRRRRTQPHDGVGLTSSFTSGRSRSGRARPRSASGSSASMRRTRSWGS